MAKDLKLSAAARNAVLDALADEIGADAVIRIYSGTKPANVASGIGAATLLAELTGGDPFAGSASGGVLTANAITEDSAADATGTAAWFRIFQADGTTSVLDGTVGVTSDYDMQVSTTAINVGIAVQVTALTITQPNG